MFIRRGKRAQTTAEYAIVIALVIGAIVAMQTYVRRGLQGKIKDVVDHTGKAEEVGGKTLEFSGSQYEPYYTESTASTTQSASSTEDLQKEGAVARTSTGTTGVTRTQTMGWEGQE